MSYLADLAVDAAFDVDVAVAIPLDFLPSLLFPLHFLLILPSPTPPPSHPPSPLLLFSSLSPAPIVCRSVPVEQVGKSFAEGSGGLGDDFNDAHDNDGDGGHNGEGAQTEDEMVN